MRQKTRKKHRKGKRIVLTLLVLILTISAVRFAVNQTAFQELLHFNTDVASMEHGWNLILVNWEYKIPKDWKVELTELSNGQSVDSRIYPDLQQMFDDMRALYRLDSVTGSTEELGPLPSEAIALIITVIVIWVLLIAWRIADRLRARKENG